MKQVITFLAIFFFAIARTLAADIVVEEFGLQPAYPTITDAVAAASNGDRIIIKNRAGNIPWIENISVNKSLQFLPFDNDTFFVCQGTWTISLTAGQAVTIIGMKNTNGSITTSSNPGTNKSATINVHGSYLLLGDVNVVGNGYELNVTHTKFDGGYVYMYFGSVIGCDITAPATAGVVVQSGSTVLNDTVFVIGNKIVSNASGSDGITMNTTTSHFHIKNNFIKSRYMGIRIGNACNGANLVYNNTIQTFNSSSSCYAIDIYQVQGGDILEVMNNVIDFLSTGTTTGINNDGGNSGTINVYYNHVDVSATYPISTGFTFTGNNTTSAGITLASDGRLGVGSLAINGANPAAPFYDLDLSTGDAGAYGGSYTIDNYFPLFNGSSRVYLNTYPFNVRAGNTLNIKANSFDR